VPFGAHLQHGAKQASALSRRCYHTATFGNTDRQWFFAEHVHAVLEGAFGDFRVQRVRCGDKHRVYQSTAQQLPIVGKAGYAKLLCNLPGAFCRSGADRGELSLFDTLDKGGMRHTHTTHPNDAKAHPLHVDHYLTMFGSDTR
jgi:hypothetical protein